MTAKCKQKWWKPLNAKNSTQYGADKMQEMVELKVIQKYVAAKMQVEMVEH